MNPEEIISLFSETYGPSGEKPVLFFAPGRVNLIGEHTDYNEGYVLPCALDLGTYLAVRKNGSHELRISSGNKKQTVSLALSGKYMPNDVQWVNYPLGIMEILNQGGMHIDQGLDMYFSGNIPVNAGLSSSASIEMATTVAMNELFGFGLKMEELVRLARNAENEFVGVSCGIMDQFASGMGKKDHALFLNCGTLNHNLVPLRTGNHRLLVMNTNKPRGLAGSKYNERVAECRRAMEQMKPASGFSSLGQMNVEDFELYSSYISDPVALKRARHVVTENRRVLESVKALWHGQTGRFGDMMVESHSSLRDDYEVTGKELDTLVEIALEQQGVIGARMTGAGFGGCAIALVEENNLEKMILDTGSRYAKVTGLIADFYIPVIGDGARRINIG